MGQGPRPDVRPCRQGKRAAAGAVAVGGLPGGLLHPENSRGRSRQGRPQKGLWTTAPFALGERRRGRLVCRPNPFRQYLPGFPRGEPGLSDRQRGGRQGRQGDRRSRDGSSRSLYGLQSDRNELHRRVLGFELGQAEANARKPRQFPGGVQIENRKVVCVSEDRWRLALQFKRAAAGRGRGCPKRGSLAHHSTALSARPESSLPGYLSCCRSVSSGRRLLRRINAPATSTKKRSQRANSASNTCAYFAGRNMKPIYLSASPRPLIDAVLCRGIRLRQIR